MNRVNASLKAGLEAFAVKEKKKFETLKVADIDRYRKNLLKKSSLLCLTADRLKTYCSETGTTYTSLKEEEIERAFQICLILNEGKEIDSLCILPRLKLILHIEVKNCEYLRVVFNIKNIKIHAMTTSCLAYIHSVLANSS